MITSAITIGGSIVLLIAVLAVISRLVVRFDLPAEIGRKLVHIGLGIYCISFPFWLDSLREVVGICGGAFLILIMLRMRTNKAAGLGNALHGVARDSYGDLLFTLVVPLLFYLKKDDVIAYVLPLTIFTLSDAAAALVGSHYGRLRFAIEDGHKSLEGTVIFLLTAWIVSLIQLLLLTDAPKLNVVLLGFLIAAYATLIEATSWKGWDNLFVPLAINLLLMHHLHSDPQLLLLGTCVSIGGFVLFRILRPALGFDVHITYLASAVLITIGISSTTWNIVLPAVAFLCHIAAERQAPCVQRFPHLAACLAMIFVSLFWYMVADIWSLHTVYSFNITFACLGTGLLWLCFNRRWITVLSTLGMFLLVQAEWLNRHSYTPVTHEGFIATMATLVCMALITRIGRRWIAQNRFLSLSLLSLAAGVMLLPLGQP